MSAEPKNVETTRRWIAGLAVTLTTIVAYLAFWQLAPGTTFIIGCVAIVALVVAAWIYGADRPDDANSPSGKAPRPPRDRDA